MPIVLIHNPAAGRGHVLPPSKPILDRLTALGHRVITLDAGPALTTPRLIDHLAGHAEGRAGDSEPASLCVIVGGDGTLHYALPALLATKTPVYHVPHGTENLFARQFRMTRDPERLVGAIKRNTVVDTDLGECNGRPFAIMCSLGFDSAIVERVAAARTHGVSKIDYVRRGLSEFLSPRIPALSLSNGGAALATRQTGLLVIANSRQYAARLDPARNASMTDGLLDIVFYPHTGRIDLAAWLSLTAVGLHTSRPALIRAQSSELSITLHTAPHAALPPPQMDGECVPLLGLTEPTPDGDHTLTARVLPKALRVLTP